MRCEDWLGWVLVTLNPQAPPSPRQLRRGRRADRATTAWHDYVETVPEEHRWDTNWKVLAENFMESYHLPVCHAGTIGGSVKLRK